MSVVGDLVPELTGTVGEAPGEVGVDDHPDAACGSTSARRATRRRCRAPQHVAPPGRRSFGRTKLGPALPPHDRGTARNRRRIRSGCRGDQPHARLLDREISRTIGGMVAIDVNSDLGESYGVWMLGDDAAMLGIVTSANVACGFHAGDPSVLRAACRLAVENDVAIGAQVSFPDLPGFGRRHLDMAPEELRYALCCTNSVRSTRSPRSPAPKSPTSSRTARCTTRRRPTRPPPERSSRPPSSSTSRLRSSACPARSCSPLPTPPGSKASRRHSPTRWTGPTVVWCRAGALQRAHRSRRGGRTGGPPRHRQRDRRDPRDGGHRESTVDLRPR